MSYPMHINFWEVGDFNISVNFLVGNYRNFERLFLSSFRLESKSQRFILTRLEINSLKLEDGIASHESEKSIRSILHKNEPVLMRVMSSSILVHQKIKADIGGTFFNIIGVSNFFILIVNERSRITFRIMTIFYAV